MFITTSRKSNLLSKRFSKYLSIFLPDISYIPRGKTNLKKLFEKAIYLGHKYFLEISNDKGQTILSIFSFKESSFFLEREYILDVLEIRSLKPLKKIILINNKVYDLKKVFYFLKKDNISLKKEYGLFEIEENIFEFLENKQSLGFKFKIISVKKFDN